MSYFSDHVDSKSTTSLSTSPSVAQNSRTDLTSTLGTKQSQRIALKRATDMLFLENSKLRTELGDALDRLSTLETRSYQALKERETRISDLTETLEESEAKLDATRKEYADKLEKLREYSVNLLHSRQTQYQTRVTVYKTSLVHQLQNEKQERVKLGKIWHQHIKEYQNQLAEMLENKRKREEEHQAEVKGLNNIIDSLKIENRTSKLKNDAIKQTLEQFKENNNLLREKLRKREETMNNLKVNLKRGEQEQAELKTTIANLTKIKKTKKRTYKKPAKQCDVLNDRPCRDEGHGDTGSVCNQDSNTETSQESNGQDTQDIKPNGDQDLKPTVSTNNENISTVKLNKKFKAGACTIGSLASNQHPFRRKKQPTQPVWK
ncbi:hypothetical protein WDU94_001744 [Cyamophila willieti]